MLELRPSCECCDKDLPPAATDAMICTYECTFCRDCVETGSRACVRTAAAIFRRARSGQRRNSSTIRRRRNAHSIRRAAAERFSPSRSACPRR